MQKTNVKRKVIRLHWLNFKTCEYKTRLVAGAAAVLQTLLIMPASAFATAEADQEIGVPQPVLSRVNGCFDVHLSPRSDRFYTLRDGMLMQYQINPLKKLGATSGDWDVIKEPGCYMRITDDEKKLLVIDKNRIYAFDIGSGRLLNKAEWEYRAYPAVIINNDELSILQRDASGGHQEGNLRAWVDLYIWDIGTLKLKRKINEFGENFGFIQDSGGWPVMTKIQDRIYLKSDRSIVVLNSKTYKPELSLEINRFPGFDRINAPKYAPKERKYDPKQLSMFELPLLSKDFRTLYVGRIAKVTDYLTGKQSNFDETEKDPAFLFDQKTREFRFENLENLSRDELDQALFANGNLSRNKNYLMHKGGNGAVLRNGRTNSPALFSQYAAGEAILVEYTSDRQLMGFQLTPGARKHLMMDKDARIPINGATFAKYYRTQAQDK